MELHEVEEKILACRKCELKLQNYGVEPRPIVSGCIRYPVVLLGQAPGIKEYETGLPFQGDSGKSVKELFHSCGMLDFDSKVYQTSVTKCFPGRIKNASTDRKPSVGEVANCSPYLHAQLELIAPQILVCLGGLAWFAYVRTREMSDPGYCANEFQGRSLSELRLTDFVGRVFSWNSMRVIPMIHPSGAANGARTANPTLDKESKRLLEIELKSLR